MKAKLSLGGIERTVELTQSGEAWTAQVGEETLALRRLPSPAGFVVLVDESTSRVYRFAVSGEEVVWRTGQGRVAPVRAGRRAADDAGGLTAPMPGTILQVRVRVGELQEGFRPGRIVRVAPNSFGNPWPPPEWRARSLDH